MKNVELIEVSNYLDRIKKYAYKDIAHIENQVLSKNPYASKFIQNSLSDKPLIKPSKLFLSKQIFLYYAKNFVIFFLYLVCYTFFNLLGRKSKINYRKDIYLIDIFFNVDNIIKDGSFNDSYFIGLYKVLRNNNKEYVFLPRLSGMDKNPLKFIKLLKILNHDKKNLYLFEYELLNLLDILRILVFILKYPIKQFELLQKENSSLDKNFNYELINSLSSTSFKAYARYLVGKKVSKLFTGNLIIISWQEFQNLEKAFNRAIRESNTKAKVYGCEFVIKMEGYLSLHITDMDVDLLVTPHTTLMNGKYNYSDSSKHNFQNGVSLRYKNIFNYSYSNDGEESALILLSYDIKESQNLLKTVRHIEPLKIKLHPATNEQQFNFYNKSNWDVTYDNLYDLFNETNIVITTTSGTALESVACGISVIIIASSDILVVNPLVDYGKGKIWDIVYNQDGFMEKVNSLLVYSKDNQEEIDSISNWYRDNFFIEPTEINISKAFELC